MSSTTVEASLSMGAGPADGPILDAIPPQVDRMLAAVEDRLLSQRLPTSTYRVQLNSSCRFCDVAELVPYWHALGISDLYASPFLRARPGSLHGYDIIDHSVINAEIGDWDELRSLRSALRERDMGLIADVVPNHMAASPMLNGWWQDLLENGPSSIFASYFDIDWSPLKPDLADKILLPVLGEQFGRVLEDGQLELNYGDGAFWVKYYQQEFPISPRSYPYILHRRIEELSDRLGDQHPAVAELLSILTASHNLPTRHETSSDRVAERQREKEIIKRRLRELTRNVPEIADFVRTNVQLFNGRRGEARSFDLLDELLQHQAYRLAFWRVAADEINYRRFFDINDLAAICTEHPQVFRASHQLLFQLLDEGIVTGLRIDHPDGLYDPRAYLFDLQESHFLRMCRELLPQFSTERECGCDFHEGGVDELVLSSRWRTATSLQGSPLSRPLYIVVEKILADGERLPGDWPVHGTVGYDFLNTVNGLFVDARGERPLTACYAHFIRQTLDLEELTFEAKRVIVETCMAGELHGLAHRLDRISERNRWTRDFTLSSLKQALQEVIACFTVYRTYVQPGQVLDRDVQFVEEAVARAKRHNAALDRSIFDFVRDVLLLRFRDNADDEERQAIGRFVGKVQQTTGPIMAKAAEDTAFYRYNRLVSLNEVGGDPGRFGRSVEEFHLLNQSRHEREAHTLNASSTHDSKRSEDVRARINVLSEIPKYWRERVQKWHRWNRRLKSSPDGVEAPSLNSEYLLYQTLVGTWPGMLATENDLNVYVTRLQRYMLKVVREAKLNTSWVSPNEAYETALFKFIAAIFQEERRQPFVGNMHEFAMLVAQHGRWNSLAELTLKIASPGVPDFYQGCELWNLTLVDPDNRQPVDWSLRKSLLHKLQASMMAASGATSPTQAIAAWMQPPVPDRETNMNAANLATELLTHAEDGRIKMFATMVGLWARRRWPALFSTGDYLPLACRGAHTDCVIAFARRNQQQVAIAIVPRLLVPVTGFGGGPPIGGIWADDQLILPSQFANCQLVNLFTRLPLTSSAGPQPTLPLAEAWKCLPFALLVGRIPASC